jgi:glycosyltransferase involved in cell wall biosynthesis
MDSLISIIIPAYNVERYIEKCLSSIISQTYEQFEAIVIDDGSTDGTSKKLVDLAKTDERIIVVHQNNQGVSAARNAGISISKGDYICFVDGDDFIENDYLETLINNIEDYDCIVCGYSYFDEATEAVSPCKKTENLKVDGKEQIVESYMKSSLFRQSFFGPVGKLYRFSKINSVRFDTELPSGEDIVYNANCLTGINSVKMIDYMGYYYLSNSNSITHKVANHYNPRLEHSYSLINDKITKARRELGVTDEWIVENRISNAPLRYYNEVTNLFRNGSPYSNDDKIEKIKLINNDKAFISDVLSNNFRNLGNAEKIAYMCAKIKNTVLVYCVVKAVMLKSKK